MTVLDGLQAELAAATDRLLATTAALSDPDVTAPSLLPGWSRGHVLTHVARNADSLVNLMTWAKTGVFIPQYPTQEIRDAEIAEGAGQTAKEQYAGLAAGADRFAEAAEAMPPMAWRSLVQGMRPPEHPAWYLLVRRIREVEIHHVDLGAGYTWADWPEDFVRRELHDAMAGWPYDQSTVSAIRAGGMSWTGLGEGPVVEGPAPLVLAWLTGRLTGDGAGEPGGGPEQGLRLAGKPPAAPPWLTMPAPPGLPAAPPEEYP
ncbi:maleylpyruvate isomerase family mycothiol-dependent enzyme [Sphaerisporangium corydalis]|uniref:Maleylpyruvate isomerase family mycothiol-dependent enzyme n=1 Tax=Sphaerisporangium corydalis TaxID=1441875 RepID=A0ABV9EV88_9ACTN|nr:maleylpyruvate isomerase family mycothiol-dependent enzyme [Sphaerisporangium corydalis]